MLAIGTPRFLKIVSTDNDGTGSVCDSDDDGDGFSDASDNCPDVANTAQLDLDRDGLGDACDSTTGPSVPTVTRMHGPPLPHTRFGSELRVMVPTRAPEGNKMRVSVSCATPFYMQVVDADGQVVANTTAASANLTFATPRSFRYSLGTGDSSPGFAKKYLLELYTVAETDLADAYDCMMTYETGAL